MSHRLLDEILRFLVCLQDQMNNITGEFSSLNTDLAEYYFNSSRADFRFFGNP